MLNFIKGAGLEDYRTLLAEKPEYSDSLYLDTTGHRLYHGGEALDVNVEEKDVVSPENSYVFSKEYHFTNPDGEEVVIRDAYISDVNDYLLTLHDVSAGVETPYSNGLMSVEDKFMLSQMAKLLGIQIEYQYWATVHHYSDVLNKRYDVLKQVKAYKNEEGQWQYDYDAFRWNFYDTATETATLTVTVPAGSITLKDNGIYELPKKITNEQGVELDPPTGDPVDIGDVEGKDEIATVQAMTLKFIRQAKDFNFFDGGGRAEDVSTLFRVGAMPQGVTVGELEKETVSEVVARILFPDDIHYEKVCDTSAYIKFTDEYIEKYGEGEYIKIGSKYPAVNELETVFIPETWQMYAGGQPVGEPIYKTEYVSTDYFIDDGQHLGTDPHGDPDDPQTYPVDDDPESEYNEHLTKFTVGGLPHYCDGVLDHTSYSEHDKSVYFGIINYRVLDPSVYDASILSWNRLGFEGMHSTHPHYEDTEIPFNESLRAGWPILSNASDVSTESNWNLRNVEPDEPFDPSIKAWCLGVPEKEYYLKWPSATPYDQQFYVYIPEEGEIKKCGGAHDGANEEYSAEQTAHAAIDPSTGEELLEELSYDAIGVPDVSITHLFKRWIIDKAAVITNVKITIGPKEEEEGE